jgi:hypothetical protein
MNIEHLYHDMYTEHKPVYFLDMLKERVISISTQETPVTYFILNISENLYTCVIPS